MSQSTGGSIRSREYTPREEEQQSREMFSWLKRVAAAISLAALPFFAWHKMRKGASPLSRQPEPKLPVVTESISQPTAAVPVSPEIAFPVQKLPVPPVAAPPNVAASQGYGKLLISIALGAVVCYSLFRLCKYTISKLKEPKQEV